MNAQTSKQKNEPTITYEYVGPGDTPTKVSTGHETYEVVDGRFTAPAKFAQALHYLGFDTRGEARVKPRANGESRGIGAHMGEDQSKKGVSK